MAKVEIDESELQDARKLRAVVEAINKHPKAGLLLEEAYKTVNPEAKTPRLDQVAQQNAPVEDLKKKISDLEKSIAEKEADAEKNRTLGALQAKIDAGNANLKQQGWTDDGIKMLTEFREKEGIIDPLVAAAYYEKKNGPVAQPVVPSSGIGAWNFQDVPKESTDYTKKLLDTRGDSETLAMQEAMSALKELRGPGR